MVIDGEAAAGSSRVPMMMGPHSLSRFMICTTMTVLVTACYIHTRAEMIDPVIARPSLCVEAVDLFDAPSAVSEPYVEVARLSVWWPPDMVARTRNVEEAVRSKAAKLGANGLIRGRLIGSDSIQPRYEGDVAGVAIFLPRDSVSDSAQCQ